MEKFSVPTCGGQKGFPSPEGKDGKKNTKVFSVINKNSQSYSMKFLIITHNHINKVSMMIRRID